MVPTLLGAFWIYTLITAITPGPGNILAFSSATSHGFRQNTRVLTGISLGLLTVMLLCAGISFSLAVIDPAAVHLLSWTGVAYTVWLTWRIATSPTKEDGLQTEPISFWASLALQLVDIKIILCGVTAPSTLVLPQTQVLGWVVGVGVLLAMIGTFGNVRWALVRHLFQRLLHQYGRQLSIVLVLLLVYCVVRIFY